MRKLFLCALLTGLIGAVNSCSTVTTSSAQAIYNHRNLEKNVTDQYLTLRAYQAIDIDSDHFKNANINIAAFNRIVLLSGQAPTAWQKKEAGHIVGKIYGKDAIYNFIHIHPPASRWSRLQDAWITAKIEAKLISSSTLDASQIKVITENRQVFLMGILPPRDAQTAVQLARETEGVMQVVKIFSYLNISKTAVTMTAPLRFDPPA